MIDSEYKIKIKPLHKLFKLPERATPGSAGFDMRYCGDESIVIEPGQVAAISLGCAVEMPLELELQIRPRSGLALKNKISILNSPGCVDSDYRGEVKAIVINHGEMPFTVSPGDRICQATINFVPVASFSLVEDLSSSVRSDGGFGSTGL
jgi:dUTP pyrophosphatase